jgi:phosphoglycolate phosphatase
MFYFLLMSEVKHIIWDWNGTLIDDVSLCVHILNSVLTDHGKEKISINQYRKTFFFPVSKFYESLSLPCSGEEYERLAQNYIKKYREEYKGCILHDHAFETIKSLKMLGVSQSIFSAGMQSDLEEFVNFYGLLDFMTVVDGANNIYAKGKGDRVHDHFIKVSHHADQVLFVGDTLHDAEVATSVGCDALLFEKGHFCEERLRNSPAQSFNNLLEVLKYLRD